MEAVCEQCQIKFQAKRKTAKYCSAKCKQKSMRVSLSEQQSVQGADALSDSSRLPSTTLIVNESSIGDRVKTNSYSPALEAVQWSTQLPDLQFVSSGVAEIDTLTGGFPRERITEIFGMKGVGKTTLMSRLVADPQLKIYYVDTENALVRVPKNVEVLRESVLELMAEKVEAALSKYDLVVVDSVASIIPRAELEGAPGEGLYPLKAKLMGQWTRRLNHFLPKGKAALVFINQQRETMQLYGPKTFTPGGKALGFAASLRLELKSNKADRFDGGPNGPGGHWVQVEIEKSRFCAPYQKTKFKLYHSED